MNICVPVISENKPYLLCDWKRAPYYCLLDESGEQKQILTKESLEQEISVTSIEQVLESRSIGSILCPSMPVMTKRIFSSSGVEVSFTGAESLEQALKEWKAGRQVDAPESFHFTTGCNSSCSSCSSDCK